MKKFKQLLCLAILFLLIACKKEKYANYRKLDLDCEIQEQLIELQNKIQSKESLEKDINKLLGEKSLSDKELLKIFVNDPISDAVHDTDYNMFKPCGINNSLEVDYTDFKDLVAEKISAGYSDMLFNFVSLSKSDVDELATKLSPDDGNQFGRFKDDLYVLITFKGKKLKDVTYMIFNLSKRYDITQYVNLSNLYLNFMQSNISNIIKTKFNTSYIPVAERYNLFKVQLYLNYMDNYFKECNPKIVSKLKFDVCFGENNTTQKSIYLTSIPEDINGPLTDFPYYDQGSLEP